MAPPPERRMASIAARVQKCRAQEVGLKRVEPVLERLVRTKRRRGVVDEDGDAAERALGERHQRACVALVAHVRALKRGTPAVSFDRRGRFPVRRSR